MYKSRFVFFQDNAELSCGQGAWCWKGHKNTG